MLKLDSLSSGTRTASQWFWRKIIPFVAAVVFALTNCEGKKVLPGYENMEVLGQKIYNPLPDDLDHEKYHTPLMPPVEIEGCLYPILIPKTWIKGAVKNIETGAMTTRKITGTNELQNIWDETTWTLRLFYPLRSFQLEKNDNDDIAQLVKSYRESRIKFKAISISGHADRSWSDQFNQKLSEQRITSIRDALIKNWVPLSEIAITENAYGENTSRDIDGTKNAYERRVDLQIVDTLAESLKWLNPDVVLVDNSLSMRPYLTALETYLKTEGRSNTAFYWFDDVFWDGGDFEEKNTKYLSQAQWKTPIVRSTIALMDYISQARRNKKTTLVILSDGYDTSSAQGIDVKTKGEITRIGKLAISGHYTDITVYVVGATPEISEILKTIATKSGGKIFPVK